ncbi:imelysin family protein [Jannaschia marina]|uniref:imelysin family protein n=1 Tax=Jannaschia marina TaxID=2741674 RepID=UPI0015CD9C1A|nr:imelysin family protein [Jannaschia marina]
MIRSLALVLALTAPAAANPLDDHVLPRVAAFAGATEALAQTDCDVDALKAAYAPAATAWAAMSHLTLGPVEAEGRGQVVLFWPDGRDATRRGLALLRERGAEGWTPEGIARASAAARGLGALERLIWEAEAEPCALTRALTRDLADTAARIETGWTNGFADLMRTPGTAGNARFLDESEVRAAFFTALMSGLEHLSDRRLGAPLGTFAEPRPARAELRRSGLSLAMVVAALEGMRELAAAMADAPETDAAFARALDAARRVDTPDLSQVAEPGGRLRVEALQTAVDAIRQVADVEIGQGLGIAQGFNSADGD